MTPEFFEANWPFILIVLLVVLVLAFFWLAANRTTSVKSEDKRDVLDEGAAPAQRNQALIDAPRAAIKDMPVPEPEPAPEPSPVSAPAPAPAAPLIDEDPAPPVLGAAPQEPSPEPVPAPAPTPDPAPVAATTTGGDDLTVIKGLGPKLAKLLNSLGVTSYSQIAAWDDAEIDRIDAQLDRFQGRIRRDSWVEQAKLLAAGDQAGFSDKFGQNG